MEILEPNGFVHQCCSEWTHGTRGDANTTSLLDVWNGPGYQFARRKMAAPETVGEICKEICPRLYDRQFAEEKIRIEPGSDRFVQNQLLLAEDIAERREVVRGTPTSLTICPSTYCNYDCIMCLCGRTPRRDLPDDIWTQVTDLLPALARLTIIGGEPFADPRTLKFLLDFDVAKYPDTAVNVVTNGSLLTERLLRRLERCTFGAIVVSANAGNAETYAKVQRGLDFGDFLANLDALAAFRSRHHRSFGLSLSFVIQPANIDSLIEFAELARHRNLEIRLLPMNVDSFPELNFYLDDAQVAHVVRRLDEFAEYCARVKPDWRVHAYAAKEAVLGEVARRRTVAGLAPLPAEL
jgi:molybdenum cofactor biosynthesis enzyme MoaA